MANNNDYLAEYREFFAEFAETIEPNDQLPVKLGSYDFLNTEVVGGIVFWCLQYLKRKKCPPTLISQLVKMTIEEMRTLCREKTVDCGFNPHIQMYKPLRLMQATIGKVNEICLRYLDNSKLETLPMPVEPIPPLFDSFATMNKRKRMEDYLVVIDDLNTMFNVQDATPSSYYAVFDGHGGQDAAMYAASHLHQFLVESPNYPTDPRNALKDAFLRTHELFLQKCTENKIRSGTTAVCALYKPKEKMLHLAWVGDSQAIMNKGHKILQLVEPHKPDLPAERNRIGALGGFVTTHQGCARVNGILAVSRAIGDLRLNQYLSAEPSLISIPLDGSEDFLVVASDGIWDGLSARKAAQLTSTAIQYVHSNIEHRYISSEVYELCKKHNINSVAQILSLFAVGLPFCTDNISVIVVFLKDPRKHEPPPNKNPFTLDSNMAHEYPDYYLGPETSVDDYNSDQEAIRMLNDLQKGHYDLVTYAEVAASAMVHTDTVASVNNNPLEVMDTVDTLDVDLELQRQQSSECDWTGDRRHDTPTPPADEVLDSSGVVDNVGESDDSDDEWDFYRNPNEKPTELPQSNQDKVQDTDDMSQLNPNAAEFIPVSPTRSVSSPVFNNRDVINDMLIAQSPRRPVPMDIDVPNPVDFQCEVKQRPSDVYEDFTNSNDKQNSHSLSSQEIMENLLNGKNVNDIEFHPSSFTKSPTENNPFFESSEKSSEPQSDEVDFEKHEFVVKEQDPMSMSYYQDKDEEGDAFSTNPFDLNKVQPLPEDEIEESSEKHDFIESESSEKHESESSALESNKLEAESIPENVSPIHVDVHQQEEILSPASPKSPIKDVELVTPETASVKDDILSVECESHVPVESLASPVYISDIDDEIMACQSKSPLPEECPTKSPLLEECQTKSPLEECQTKSPLLEEYQTKSPLLEECPTKSPLLEECPTKSPLLEEYQTKSPLPEECQMKSPLPEEFLTKSPLPEECLAKSPVPEECPAKSPLPEECLTKLPQPDDAVLWCQTKKYVTDDEILERPTASPLPNDAILECQTVSPVPEEDVSECPTKSPMPEEELIADENSASFIEHDVESQEKSTNLDFLENVTDYMSGTVHMLEDKMHSLMEQAGDIQKELGEFCSRTEDDSISRFDAEEQLKNLIDNTTAVIEEKETEVIKKVEDAVNEVKNELLNFESMVDEYMVVENIQNEISEDIREVSRSVEDLCNVESDPLNVVNDVCEEVSQKVSVGEATFISNDMEQAQTELSNIEELNEQIAEAPVKDILSFDNTEDIIEKVEDVSNVINKVCDLKTEAVLEEALPEPAIAEESCTFEAEAQINTAQTDDICSFSQSPDIMASKEILNMHNDIEKDILEATNDIDFTMTNEPALMDATESINQMSEEASILLEQVSTDYTSTKTEMMEQLNFSKIESECAPSEINSFLERSAIPDITSPLSPTEQDSQLWKETEIKCETISPEYAVHTITSPSEDSKDMSISAPTVNVEPEIEAQKIVEELNGAVEPSESVALVSSAVLPAAVAAAAVAVSAVTSSAVKAADKPKAASSTGKKPAPKTTTTTKPSPATKTQAPTRKVASTLSAPKPAPTKTTPLKPRTSATPTPSPRTPMSRTTPTPKPKSTTPITKAAPEKKPLANGDVKAPVRQPPIRRPVPGAVPPPKPAPTATKISPTVAAKPLTNGTSKPLTNGTTKTAASRPTSAPTKTATAAPRTTLTARARPTNLTAKSSTTNSTTTTKTSNSASKTSTLSSAPSKPRTTAVKSSSLTSSAKPAAKAPDAEKRIKDTANKQISAARGTNTTTRTTLTSRTTTTKKDSELPSSKTTTRTTTTTMRSVNGKKPTETTKTTVSKTKNGTVKLKADRGDVVCKMQEITTVLSDEPQLMKDNSPVETSPVDNSQLPPAIIAD